MAAPLLNDIAAAIEAFAPRGLQESYDNSGWQVLTDPAGRCTGVVTCVDATPAVIAEAVARGANLVVSHHPVLFRGQKSFTGATPVQRVVMDAIASGVSVYSCHTSIDSAPGGVSAEIARRLGLEDVEVLVPSSAAPGAGLGAVGNLPSPLTPGALVELVKGRLGVPMARCSRPAEPMGPIGRVALCGGSGSEFLPRAVAAGARAYITSDTRHHDFVDWAPSVFIIDIGHWEAEACVRQQLESIIGTRFPELEITVAAADRAPVIYL